MPWGNWFSLRRNVRARCCFLHYFSYNIIEHLCQSTLCHSARSRSFVKEDLDCRLEPFFCTLLCIAFLPKCLLLCRVLLSELHPFVKPSQFSLDFICHTGRQGERYLLDRTCQICLHITPKILANNKLCHYCSLFWGEKSNQVCQTCLWLMCFVIAPVFWLSVLQSRVTVFNATPEEWECSELLFSGYKLEPMLLCCSISFNPFIQ